MNEKVAQGHDGIADKTVNGNKIQDQNANKAPKSVPKRLQHMCWHIERVVEVLKVMQEIVSQVMDGGFNVLGVGVDTM